MNTKLITLTAITALAIICQAGAQQTNNKQVRRYDRPFLVQAASVSLHEITLGELAQSNSTNPDVQQFGVILATDHAQAYEHATALLNSMGFDAPTNQMRRQIKMYYRLANLTGTDFDVAFVNEMIRDHVQSIRTFQAAAMRAANAETRAYARDQLPVLAQHHVMALQIWESSTYPQPVETPTQEQTDSTSEQTPPAIAQPPALPVQTGPASGQTPAATPQPPAPPMPVPTT